MLNYAFNKIDHKAYATADLNAPIDPLVAEARARFLAPYNLREYNGGGMHSLALKALVQGIRAKRIPSFVIGMLEGTEINQINQAVKKNDN